MSAEGRIALAFMITFLVYYFPESCTRMVQLFNAKSRYARFEYKPYNNVPHVVLIGTVSQTSLKNFLEEYFHDDHGEHQRHCVLMQPVRPSADTEILMLHKYLGKLFYVEGTTQEQFHLRRCLVERAAAVIILSDKFSFDAEIEDTTTILQAMIIKNYLNQIKKQMKGEDSNIVETRVCMQLLAPESIIHYKLSLNKDDLKNDQIVCIESMKLSLLAKSC